MTRTHEKAAQVEALRGVLVDGLTDWAVILLDAEGRVLNINAGARTMTGYGFDEIVGRDVSCLYPQPDIDAGSPAALLAEVRAQGRREATVLRRRKDGSAFTARLVLTRLLDPATGTLLGFAEMLRVEPDQSRLDRFIKAVQDAMLDGLVVTDARGNIQVCNGACERMFGYAEGELIGRNVDMLMPAPTRQAHDGYLQRYGETGRRSLVGAPRELVGARKDGSALPVMVAIGEATLEGERFFVGVISDLTQRKAVEAGTNRARRLEAIGQLTGGVAHDFNNILMVIIATAEMLADDLGGDTAENAKRREWIESILGSAERASDLTRQLLAFARRQPLHPKPSRLNDLIADTGRMIARTLGEHVEVESRLTEDLWVTNVDRAQLEAALINLCLNARDAMPDGGRLTIETANVVLDEEYARAHSGAVAGDYAMLAVSDSGVGIPASVLDRVFEPFFTTKELGRGTGLGLSMVYGFIKQSGGHVSIYSEEGLGTTVRLYLPRVAEDALAADAPVVQVPPTGSERILVVEDDEGVRAIVAGHLRGLGYAVEEAVSGQHGLTRLAEDARFDLLLSDLVMPGMSGRALVEQARERQPGLRVLYMSGYAHEAMVRNGRLEPNMRVLSKPFRRLDLARAVRAVLDDIG